MTDSLNKRTLTTTVIQWWSPTNVQLPIRSARRGRTKLWDRSAAPIGAIRVRLRKSANGRRKLPIRLIKVQMGGPTARRWMRLARYWWLHNRGPIPAGMRVAHLDGDTLNDDPANYGLMTAGDVLFLCHERDPERSERNRAAASAATATMNRERALVRRILEWLPSRWYPVDHQASTVLNRPRKKRWHIYADLGFSPASRPGCRSAALGWPGHSTWDALLLTVLFESRVPLTLIEALGRAEARRAAFGLAPLDAHGFYCFSWRMRRREWLGTFGGGRNRKHYGLTEIARAARERSTQYVPVRGSELSSEVYAGFRKQGVDQ